MYGYVSHTTVNIEKYFQRNMVVNLSDIIAVEYTKHVCEALRRMQSVVINTVVFVWAHIVGSHTCTVRVRRTVGIDACGQCACVSVWYTFAYVSERAIIIFELKYLFWRRSDANLSYIVFIDGTATYSCTSRILVMYVNIHLYAHKHTHTLSLSIH